MKKAIKVLKMVEDNKYWFSEFSSEELDHDIRC